MILVLAGILTSAGLLDFVVRNENRPAQQREQLVGPRQLRDPSGIARVRQGLSGTESVTKALGSVGAPYMSNPQRYVVRQTAGQALEQTVKDIGHHVVAWQFAGGGGLGFFVAPTIIAIRMPLLRNVKIKRLIEAGRRDPARVGRLLVQGIREVLPHHANAVEVDKRFARGELRETTETWKRACSYQPVIDVTLGDSPGARLREIELRVLCSLFVLSNIEYPRGARALAEVIRMKNPRPGRCTGFFLFCVDQAFELSTEEAESELAIEAAATHKRLVRGTEPGLVARVSRWNAPWDIADPLMLMTGADTSGIETFQVDFPNEALDREFTEKQKEDILENFLKFYDAVKDSLPK